MSIKQDFDAELIKLVRANPTLFARGIRLKPYDLMKKKAEIWRSIGSSLGVDQKYCATRWKNMRDKFRRELQTSEEIARKAGGADESLKGSNWHLMDKMRFLESHIRPFSNCTKSVAENTRSSWNEMETLQVNDEVINNDDDDDDDPLQEAMEDQASGTADSTQQKDVEISNALQIAPPAAAVATTSTPAYIRRIETLLEGMDNINRTTAEKRIVAYLCKCQLKTLNNEGIDDVVI